MTAQQELLAVLSQYPDLRDLVTELYFAQALLEDGLQDTPPFSLHQKINSVAWRHDEEVRAGISKLFETLRILAEETPQPLELLKVIDETLSWLPQKMS